MESEAAVECVTERMLSRKGNIVSVTSYLLGTNALLSIPSNVVV
jgi:hypothetical protein